MSISFRISPSLAKPLQDDIRECPLRDKEVRGVVGMSSYYITAAATDLNEHKLTALFTCTIDGINMW